MEKFTHHQLNNLSTNTEFCNSVLAFVRGGIWKTS